MKKITLKKIPTKPKVIQQKIFNVSTNDGKTFSEKVHFLDLWSIGDVTSEKIIEIKGEESRSRNGLFKQILFTFEEFYNYIYTKSDVNQKGFDNAYAGTASRFSVSGLSAGKAKTVIRTSKTDSANDLTELYRGPAERVEVEILASREDGVSYATLDDAVHLPDGYPAYCIYIQSGWNRESEARVQAKLKEWGNTMGSNLLVALWNVGDPSYQRLVQLIGIKQVPAIILTRSRVLDVDSYMMKIDDPSDVNDVEKLVEILPVLVNSILGLDLIGYMKERRSQKVKSFLKRFSSKLKRIKRLKIACDGFEVELFD